LIQSRQPTAADGGARVVAVACDDLYLELSRWVGADGCHALFRRALTEARTEFTNLDLITLRPRSDPYVDGVAESIMSRGDAATAEALESVLVHLVELLGRLIGDDMAAKLIERSIATPVQRDATPDKRREEA
jgi:hypothetical protein